MIAKEQEPDAYDFVAAWHERQAARFWEIAKDEPRIDADSRMKSAGAAQHHAGSAAALRLAAINARRKAIGADS